MFEQFRKQQTITLFAAGSVFVGCCMGAIATKGTAQTFSLLTAVGSIGMIGGTAYAGQRIANLEDGVKAKLENDRALAKLRAETAELELRETKAALEESVAEVEELRALLAPLEEENEALKRRYDEAYRNFNASKKELQDGIVEIRNEYREKLETEKSELSQRFEDARLALKTRMGKQFTEKLKEVRQRFEAEWAQKEAAYYSDCLQKIKSFKSQHRERERYLLAQIEEIQQQSMIEGYNLQMMVAKLQGDCTELVQALEEWIAKTQTWKESANNQFQTAMQSTEMRHQQEVRRLYGQIETFFKPKRLSSRDKASHSANQLADWFLERQIIVDVEDAIGYKDRDVVFIKPRLHTLEELKKTASQIWQYFELVEAPEFAIEGGNIKITLFTGEPIDDKPVTFKERKPKDDSVASIGVSDGSQVEIYAAADKIRHYIKTCERWHCFVNGDSGAGKDALVNNIINIIYQEMSAEGVEVEIVIIDGKYPNDSPIIINGKEVEPRYYGIRHPGDEEEDLWHDGPDCLEGLLAMRRSVQAKLRIMADKKKAGEEWKPRRKTIYVVTEAEEQIAAYDSGVKRPASQSILTVARLGRSIGDAVIVVGQSPNAQSYNFLVANLNNFACVYLRENAYKGARERIPTSDQRKPILHGIKYLTNQSAGLPDRTPEKYWGLWKFPGEPCFLAFSPAPNSFSFTPSLAAFEERQPQEPIAFSGEAIKPSAEQLLDRIEQRAALLEEDDREFRMARLSPFAQIILTKVEEKGWHEETLTGSRVRNYILRSQCDDKRNKLDADKIRRLFSELARNGFGTTEGKGKQLTWKLGKTAESSSPELQPLEALQEAQQEAID